MDENQIEDRRKIKQDELGSAATIRTTTLKPKDGAAPKPSAKTKTPAQQAVAQAKAIDEGRPESAIAEPTKKKKAPAPAWSSTNTAAQDRKIDAPESRVHAPTTPTKNPLEEMELTNFDDQMNWCHCGRALYGRELEHGEIVMCRDGHEHKADTKRLSWEEAARVLRAEQSAVSAAVLMGASAIDIAAFWAEEDAARTAPAAETRTEAEQPTRTEQADQQLGTREMLDMLMGAGAPPMEAASHMTPVELQLSRDVEALTERVANLERVNLALLEHTANQQLFTARLAHASGADFETVRDLTLSHEKLTQALKELRASRAKRLDPKVWLTILATLAGSAAFATSWAGGLAQKPQKG